MLQAIVFDLDGVLIDSEPLMRFAFARTYRQVIGAGEPPIDAYLEHMGESFPQIMAHLGLPDTMWPPYRELCQKHIDRITLFPEVRGLLEWAVSLDLKLALLTGKDYLRTRQLLEHFGLDQFFQVVVTSDRLRQPKPNPEGMVYALRLLECAPAQAVLIGDSVSDILCAQQAAVRAIAVTWGIKPERVQRLCEPDYIVHTWPALRDLLRQLYYGTAQRTERCGPSPAAEAGR